MTGGNDASKLEVGVWWDLESCPVPDGFDASCVCGSIESAMEKENGGPCEVVVYGVGNLEYISLELLKKLADSGIMLVHAPCGWKDIEYLIYDWSKITRGPKTALLISSKPEWSNIDCVGFPIRRAYTKHFWMREGTCKEFVWETLLSENQTKQIEPTHSYSCKICEQSFESSDDYKNHLESEYHMERVVPDFFCNICCRCFKRCVDFFDHLKGQEHRACLFKCVPCDEYDIPIHFCRACQYPAYDEDSLDIHNASDEHKYNLNKKLNKKLDKKLKKKLAEKEDSKSEDLRKLVYGLFNYKVS